MNKQFQSQDTLGGIVLKFPQAADLFKQYGLDFCCGGDRSLAAASNEHQIDQTSLLEELNERYEDALKVGLVTKDWMSVSFEQLIHHIVNTHHAYLNQAFPTLSELTLKILRVHGQHHGDTLSVVHQKFSELRSGLEAHMIKEEEVIFPQIVDYEKSPSETKRESLQQLLSELDREHEESGAILKVIREVTANYALPEDACNTFAYVYRSLEDMEANIFEHIHLENNVLFLRLSEQTVA